ncbi:uncharacterized protein BDZ99DRAFT_497006 [Mytilinidion resinicola]|uniref:Mid2 domain-containing protein n=1 Tax=Mytilinidion resinicola TaxID=574789 RepID=A0A6A6YXC4_9PEZI|nr:uncharacterized protein BDZ99DRAFT_497006 [Mytilinidion resinicola]KAF2812634.1 hypothetical protein BDZ99DRAFT_497006 [Mytilinidion resinicola]
MLRSTLAFLAPAMVSAMAFPWAGPEPTLVMPEGDNWSPAPTKAPELGLLELFKKRAAGDNTCGYISGSSASSLTCNDSNYVCATNTYYGVHGCCDPNSLASCSIPTTCIASSDLAASCTDAACSSNNYIAKCTLTDSPYCYEWRYVYSTRTVMTEFGCAESAFTISVQRTFSGDLNSAAATSSEAVIPISTKVITVVPSSSSVSSSSIPTSPSVTGTAATAIATSSNISLPTTKKKSKSHVGAIVGGVIGGLVVIGAIIFGIVFALLKKKKAKNAAAAAPPPNTQGPAPGVAEFKPQPGGFAPQQGGYQPPPQQQGGYYQQDIKPGFNNQPQVGVPGQEIGGNSQAPYSPPMSPAPQYSAPFNQGPPQGISEAAGTPIQPAPQQPHAPQHQVYEAP